MRTRHLATGFAAAVLGVVVCAQAHASGPDLFGFGPRASGLAGSGASIVDGYDAVYENPAGLARIHHRRLTLGYYYGKLDLDVAPSVQLKVDDASATVLGGEVPLPLTGVLADRIGLGFGFYMPVGVITRAHVPESGEQTFILLQDRPQVVAFQVAVGGRVGDWSQVGLDVGVGVLALAALVGNINISADAAGRISARSEQQLVTDFAPILGATLHFEMGDLAVVYRGVSHTGYDVTIDNNLQDLLPVGLPELRLHGEAQYDPANATLEMAWHSLPKVRVLTGVTWKRWSDYCCETTHPGLAGPPSKKSSPVPYPRFNDVFVGRLGFERIVTPELLLRLGYAFEPSPVQNLLNEFANYVDNDRHVIGLGLGWSPAPWRIDAFAQMHLLARDSRSGGAVYVGGVTVGVDLK